MRRKKGRNQNWQDARSKLWRKRNRNLDPRQSRTEARAICGRVTHVRRGRPERKKRCEKQGRRATTGSQNVKNAIRGPEGEMGISSKERIKEKRKRLAGETKGQEKLKAWQRRRLAVSEAVLENQIVQPDSKEMT